MSSSSAPKIETASPPSDTPITNARFILTVVGRLLMDYAVQLRDDVSLVQLDNPQGLALKDEDNEQQSSVDDKKVSSFNRGNAATAELEEAVQLTEADVVECRGRLQRLQRILHILYSVQAGTSSSNRNDHNASAVSSQKIKEKEDMELIQDYSETIQRNSVLKKVLKRFERINQQFQGMVMSLTTLTDIDVSENTNATVTEVQGLSHATRTIQPLLTPVSLSEGALSAFSRNVGVVFRRRSPSDAAPSGTHASAQDDDSRSSANRKRKREEDGATQESLNHWAKLAVQQRKSRFVLYTLRSALLPRVNRVCAPFYVSPAVQELAQLNAAAERLMLERAWCVQTKAHLLREAPSVAQDVEENLKALREAIKNFSPSQQETYIRDVSYVRFVCTDKGILRLCVQHALFMDITYDLMRKQWTLLDLHWNLFTTAAGASLISASSTDFATQGNFTALESQSYQQLQPQHREALFTFLQKALTQDGLCGGVRAANRLVCAVVLDALAIQLQHLQEFFFSGGILTRLIDVEVRSGTFISVHLALPELLGADGPTTSASLGGVHVKLMVCGGTVMMERVCGTSIASRSVTLLLGTSSLIPSPSATLEVPSRVVVDMEAMLWRCVSAEG